MTSGGRLNWYVRRLSVMSLPEIAHRFAELGTLRRLRAGYRRGDGPADLPSPHETSFCRASEPQLPRLPFVAEMTSFDARALLAGEWHALGYEWTWRQGADTWHAAPDTGALWPRKFFGDIDFRAGNPCGDARVVWEPARLQQLLELALLSRASAPHRGAAVDLLESQLLSWCAANPPLEGVHYVSAMECGLRILAVCHALDLVRGELRRPDETWRALIGLVASHAGLILNRLSLYSSAGNHTIAESAGLVYAGLMFPELPDHERWLSTGLGLLESEAARQVLPDGGSLEQAFWYLAFVADLCGLVLRLLETRGKSVPGEIRAAFDRASAFLSEMSGLHGEELPDIGDRDDGFALSARLRLVPRAPRAPLVGIRSFPDSGYTLAAVSAQAPLRVLMDHGPLGMPPSFGHGHADALSLVVTWRGETLLIDPGTGSYAGHPDWRSYFRSTAAHNTVRVDGQDQAVQASAFMWVAPFAATLDRVEQRDGAVALLASHRAFEARYHVVHWRAFVLYEQHLLIWDYLRGQGVHDAEINWHSAANVRASDGVGWYLGDELSLEIVGLDTQYLYKGSDQPVAGWRAPRYGQRQAVATVRGQVRAELPIEIRTCIAPVNHPWRTRDQLAWIEELRKWVLNSQSA